MGSCPTVLYGHPTQCYGTRSHNGVGMLHTGKRKLVFYFNWNRTDEPPWVFQQRGTAGCEMRFNLQPVVASQQAGREDKYDFRRIIHS